MKEMKNKCSLFTFAALSAVALCAAPTPPV